ncbi:MAG: helix-turn-helix domain-containing protein [Candidatus Wildermuthbacteria bacterium]|nr:helix-turn-helix domain-containing protein [Candidatus Wildermuthbacteria bacterium]
MARLKDREKALALRKQEMSYSQIKKILKVNKSTLSIWLKNYPLSKERISELRGRNEKRIERYRETMRRKREYRLRGFYKEQEKLIFPMSKREEFLAGIFLYWGEGTKSHPAELSVSNTDPSIIKFFISWLAKNLFIPKEKIKIQLQLYADMETDREINFWSEALNIPHSQFAKPYIKKTSSKRINHKGGFGHGTCLARTGNARLSERILMSIKAITHHYDKLRA